MPHQTNRSSRRSDACHLCSLQSWKVKKASTASQQSLHVNITYSSDEGGFRVHTPPGHRGRASFFICANLGGRQRQLNPTDPRAPRQVTGSVSWGLAQSQGRTLAHRASAVLSYCSVQCFEGVFKNVSGQYPLNRNCSYTL